MSDIVHLDFPQEKLNKMSYAHNESEYEDEPVAPLRPNWWQKITTSFTKNTDDDEYYADEESDDEDHHGRFGSGAEAPSVTRHAVSSRFSGGALNPPRRATVTALRLERERSSTVTVRLLVKTFEDARRGVDGLREGVQQIINFEKTDEDDATRFIDFLNGATYALDGSVEKIGDKVYLYTPSTVSIEVVDKAQTPVVKAFGE
jgi:cell division inhibitor SepF